MTFSDWDLFRNTVAVPPDDEKITFFTPASLAALKMLIVPCKLVF